MDSVVKLVCNGIYVKFQPQMNAPREGEGGRWIRKRTRSILNRFLLRFHSFRQAFAVPRSRSFRLKSVSCDSENDSVLINMQIPSITKLSPPVQTNSGAILSLLQSSFVLDGLVAATEQPKRKSNVARSDNGRFAFLLPLWAEGCKE